MAITLTNAWSQPADNGAQAGTTVTISGITLVKGRLYVAITAIRATNAYPVPTYNTGSPVSFPNSNAGVAMGAGSVRSHWLPWTSANASNVSISATQTGTGSIPFSLIVLEFSGNTDGDTWASDVAQTSGSGGDTVAPYVQTIAGHASVAQNTAGLFLAYATAASVGTWTLSGSGWSNSGLSAQYRNTTGTDEVLAIGYNVQTTPGTQADPTYESSLSISSAGRSLWTLRLVPRLNAEGGTFTLSGAAATLKRALLLSAAGGTFALSGGAATLTKGAALTHYTLSAGGATYAVSGTNAGLRRDPLISAAGGAYSLSGSPAGLLRTAVLSGEGGALAIAGQPASLLRGLRMAGEGTGWALSGQEATLRHGHVLSAGGGTLLLSGASATLTYTSSNPSTTSFFFML